MAPRVDQAQRAACETVPRRLPIEQGRAGGGGAETRDIGTGCCRREIRTVILRPHVTPGRQCHQRRHPSERWDPLACRARAKWIPAFAGMTMTVHPGWRWVSIRADDGPKSRTTMALPPECQLGSSPAHAPRLGPNVAPEPTPSMPSSPSQTRLPGGNALNAVIPRPRVTPGRQSPRRRHSQAACDSRAAMASTPSSQRTLGSIGLSSKSKMDPGVRRDDDDCASGTTMVLHPGRRWPRIRDGDGSASGMTMIVYPGRRWACIRKAGRGAFSPRPRFR